MSVSDKRQSLSHAQGVLAQLKIAFLAELPDRCDAMEGLILTLARKIDFQENFDKLYRNVHSLKGSGGTYGLPIISTICHQLEDHLEYLNGDFDRISDEFITVCLGYLDLIRQAAHIEDQNTAERNKIEAALLRLRRDILAEKRLGLLVESSPAMSKMCQLALENLPLQLTTATDGLVALERLLHQRFDLLVMGKELHTLNGLALSYALRKSESANRDIPIILLTSESMERSATEANFVIHKDTRLPENLRKAVERILA